MHAAAPYAQAITRAVSSVATHGHVDHPLVNERHDTTRIAVLLVTADRGMAGAYTANVLREGERKVAEFAEQGKTADLYVTGRRGVGYFSYRQRELTGQWIGQSDAPTPELADEIASTLLDAFAAPADEGGVAELHVVFNEFVNMVVQRPRIIRLLPLEVVEEEATAEEDILPLYDFEPSTSEVLNALLPRYIRTRLHAILLQSATAELASRQRAMHTATENAEDLIRTYTRLANQARQGEITQEISEIVSGADALKAS